MPLLDRRSAASARAMAGIYAALLERIAAAARRSCTARRLSLPVRQKAAIAAMALSGLGR